MSYKGLSNGAAALGGSFKKNNRLSKLPGKEPRSLS